MLFENAPLALGLLLALVGYVFGSVSSAIVICRLLGLPDPRGEGSGNPGTTNVLRLGGKKAAAATLVGDMLKGVLPVLLARLVTSDPLLWAFAGAGAFLGHLYPLFFRFQGGKGVATGLGVLLAWSFPAGVLTVLTWLVAAAIGRYSSAAALTAFLMAPIYVGALSANTALTLTMAAISLLTYWRHRSNIRKLFAGEESKIGEKTPPASDA